MKTIKTKDRVGFTLQKDDFEWEYFTAGGHGGQKQNKTASACRCTHTASKAVGISRDERSQLQNRKLAFQRCITSNAFKVWSNLEVTRIQLNEKEVVSVEDQVEQDMLPENLQIEVMKGGKWVKED